jgi:signal transduction histidine kinase
MNVPKSLGLWGIPILKLQPVPHKTEKMSSLGRMIAGISHEIKNPVNCVSGNLEFLKKYVDDLFLLIGAYQDTDLTNIDDIKKIQ